ncbi:MAG: type II secretion system protein [Planctomycetes bacterium]|nr:type II secretion system protein [Planctomycetota bacterium]NOG54340.1 type II secretion system protein [Planctomycetota bacterium]
MTRKQDNLIGVRTSGASLIELLIVIGVMVVLLWIVGSVMTGSGGKPGVKQQVEQQINQIELYEVYRAGFFMYGQAHDDSYPTTKADGRMNDDTTSEVFRILVEDGLPASMLISKNESVDDFEASYGSDFGPNNTSFALSDYDADDWLRARNWKMYSGSNVIILSDRWLDVSMFPEYVHNLQCGSTPEQTGYWNLLFNDGHSDTTDQPELPNGDDIFEYDGSFGANDTLMVHD